MAGAHTCCSWQSWHMRKLALPFPCSGCCITGDPHSVTGLMALSHSQGPTKQQWPQVDAGAVQTTPTCPGCDSVCLQGSAGVCWSHGPSEAVKYRQIIIPLATIIQATKDSTLPACCHHWPLASSLQSHRHPHPSQAAHANLHQGPCGHQPWPLGHDKGAISTTGSRLLSCKL